MTDISLSPKIQAAGRLSLRLAALAGGVGLCAAFWVWLARALFA